MLSEQGRLHYKPESNKISQLNALAGILNVYLPGLVHDESDLVLLARNRDIALTWMLMAQAPGSNSLTSVLGPCAPEGGRMRSHGFWGARVMSLPPVGSRSPHVRPQVIVILCVAARAHVGDPVLAGHPRRIKNKTIEEQKIHVWRKL